MDPVRRDMPPFDGEGTATFAVQLPAVVVDGISSVSDVDGKAVLGWLETGEADPWEVGK